MVLFDSGLVAEGELQEVVEVRGRDGFVVLEVEFGRPNLETSADFGEGEDRVWGRPLGWDFGLFGCLFLENGEGIATFCCYWARGSKGTGETGRLGNFFIFSFFQK